MDQECYQPITCIDQMRYQSITCETLQYIITTVLEEAEKQELCFPLDIPCGENRPGTATPVLENTTC
jgi:hypothetical protein